MNSTEAMRDALVESGITLSTGVPCSALAGIIRSLQESNNIRYVSAANEGDAVAIASGSGLSGTPAVVLMQNSGLGNAINPLTSLAIPFRIPVVLIISIRGAPESYDEPHHKVMGR